MSPLNVTVSQKKLIQELDLEQCPHCGRGKPTLTLIHRHTTSGKIDNQEQVWSFYSCSSCGKVVMGWSKPTDTTAVEIWPKSKEADESLPSKARVYLQQAINSLAAPSGAIMLAASSIDDMLRTKGYKDGSLYERIKTAATDHLITEQMKEWAHEVRLQSNEERHADEDSELPTPEEATEAINFVEAFAEYLFVLPSKIKRWKESE